MACGRLQTEWDDVHLNRNFQINTKIFKNYSLIQGSQQTNDGVDLKRKNRRIDGLFTQRLKILHSKQIKRYKTFITAMEPD